MGPKKILKRVIRNLIKGIKSNLKPPYINIKWIYSYEDYYDLYKNRIIPRETYPESLKGLYVDYLYSVRRPSTVDLVVDTRELLHWNLSTPGKDFNLKLIEILQANHIFVDMVNTSKTGVHYIPVNIITPCNTRKCYLFIDFKTKKINFVPEVFVNNKSFREILIIGPYYMH